MAKRGELTPKQARFVEEYLVDLNATAAARRAGYSNRGHVANQNGYELLKRPLVQAAISKAQAKRSERTELDQDWIIAELVANEQRAMQAEPVTDHEGNLTGEYRYEGSVANRSLELLGKHHGMFVERMQIESTPLLDLSLLTPEETATLRALIAKARREPVGDGL